MEENNNKVPADNESISGAETSATPGVPAAIGIYDRPAKANVNPMLVIGLVLGPMFEMRMMQSLSLANGDPSVFVTRPIAATLLALACAGIALGIYSHSRERRAARNSEKVEVRYP